MAESLPRVGAPELPRARSASGLGDAGLLEPSLGLRPRAPVARPALSPASPGAPAPESLRRAGGTETEAPEGLECRIGRGALFTSRGPSLEVHGVQYKLFNEDATLLGWAEGEGGTVLFGGVFDQAGGEGRLLGRDGAASEAAAVAFERAAHAVAGGAEPEPAFNAALEEARQVILGLAESTTTKRLATTLAGFLVRGEVAHVVNIGDSAVLHFSAEGVLKNETLPHNLHDEVARSSTDPHFGLWLANKLSRSIRAGSPSPADHSVWAIAPGDLLVAVSDGVLDANLLAQERARDHGEPWTETGGRRTIREIGARLAARSGETPEVLAADLRDYALDHMRARLGKPDNLGVVVVRLSNLEGEVAR